MQKNKYYSPEFKAQIVKEVQDIGSLSAVARTHKISVGSVHRWLNPKSSIKSNINPPPSAILDLKKKLADAELENRVLKELLKKTNQAWLKD